MLFCYVLLLLSIAWNHWGDLRSHGVLHIWDDSFFLRFFILVLRLQWAKKLGWLFLAVGGRTSMGEWQLIATLGGLRRHCVATDISNRSWDTSIVDSLGDQEPAAWKSCPAWFDSFGSCAVRLTKRELAMALRAFRSILDSCTSEHAFLNLCGLRTSCYTLALCVASFSAGWRWFIVSS